MWEIWHLSGQYLSSFSLLQCLNKALKLLIRTEQKFWVCFSVYECVVCVTTEYEVLASLLTSGRIELPSMSLMSWFFHCFLQLTSFLPNKNDFFWHCSKLALHFLHSCEEPLPEMCSWLYKMTLLKLMQPNHILANLQNHKFRRFVLFSVSPQSGNGGDLSHKRLSCSCEVSDLQQLPPRCVIF